MHESGSSHFFRLLECLRNIFTCFQQQFENGLIDFCLTLFKFEAWLIPDDSRSWESPEKADNVWRLFIQIMLR